MGGPPIWGGREPTNKQTSNKFGVALSPQHKQDQYKYDKTQKKLFTIPVLLLLYEAAKVASLRLLQHLPNRRLSTKSVEPSGEAVHHEHPVTQSRVGDVKIMNDELHRFG